MDMQNEEATQDVNADTIHRPDMQWFVVHTMTGQEQKAMRHIEAQVKLADMGSEVGDVRMPTEKVTETKNNKKKTITRKFFPGYLLIQARIYLVPDPEKPRRKVVNTACWRFINDTPGIIGFLGGDHPIPLTRQEVDDVFAEIEVTKTKSRPKVVFEPGEYITITDGPFSHQTGTVSEVDPDRGRLKIVTDVFGRPTSVELEYWQVERVDNDPNASAADIHG
jgi:transcriptional antiterminator NusG